MADHDEVKKRYVLECGPDGAEARFSNDGRHRYQLCRNIDRGGRGLDYRRVCFVMLNPSTADAFKLDNTITKCVRFAESWGFDRIDVVNLFSLRTPYPKDVLAAVRRGEEITDYVNDAHILSACTTADLVIAAWGNHGEDVRLWTEPAFRVRKSPGVEYPPVNQPRGRAVRAWLESEGIELHHLGLTNEGVPLHPLARGKAWIPYDRKPERWA